MNTLILGATGASGKHLVNQLTSFNHNIKVIVRPNSIIPNHWFDNNKIQIIKAEISQLSQKEITTILSDCNSVVSCLGHNLTFKGLYGKPKKLVTNAVKLITNAIKNTNPKEPIKFILLNTAGNKNLDLKEKTSTSENIIVGIIRLLLPPHTDNENAANYLREAIGQDNTSIEWVAVRPDTLTNEENISNYTIHESPTRSAILNPGKTSRINLANFMTTLLSEEELWEKWKGKMPVIYNKE